MCARLADFWVTSLHSLARVFSSVSVGENDIVATTSFDSSLFLVKLWEKASNLTQIMFKVELVSFCAVVILPCHLISRLKVWISVSEAQKKKVGGSRSRKVRSSFQSSKFENTTGIKGFYPGGVPLAFRQASNWASRQGEASEEGVILYR